MRLIRFAPLTGLVYAVLSFVAFATASGAPKAGDSGAKVIAFYNSHGSSARASDQLWVLAFVFFVFFAATVCSRGGGTPTGGLRWVVASGAAVLMAGAAVYFGFDFVLASSRSDLTPTAAQAINLLALKLFFPVGAGGLIFGVGAGLMIVRGSLLPRWLGWAAIAVGVATVTGVPGLMLLAIWSAVASILFFRRTDRIPAPGMAGSPVAAAGQGA